MTKICAKCGIENDESEYYVIRSKDRRPRLQGICKECHNGPRKVRLPRVIPEGKTCNNCGQYKALTEFHKHTTCLYGVEPICKECRLRKRREFVLKYPERRKSADLKHAYGISLAEYEVMFQR